jgi:hypothetical protein
MIVSTLPIVLEFLANEPLSALQLPAKPNDLPVQQSVKVELILQS